MLLNETELKNDIAKSINHFSEELKKLRTGRASADIIGAVEVEAYGGKSKLNTVGQVIVEDATNVKVQVWDKGIVQSVERALREANLGGSVAMDGEGIRIKFNPLTQEDRQIRVKEVGQLLEDHKITIRQIRQDYIKSIESLEGVSEDQQEMDKKLVQKHIDEATAKLEDLAKQKEADLLKI